MTNLEDKADCGILKRVNEISLGYFSWKKKSVWHWDFWSSSSTEAATPTAQNFNSYSWNEWGICSLFKSNKHFFSECHISPAYENANFYLSSFWFTVTSLEKLSHCECMWVSSVVSHEERLRYQANWPQWTTNLLLFIHKNIHKEESKVVIDLPANKSDQLWFVSLSIAQLPLSISILLSNYMCFINWHQYLAPYQKC